MYQSKLVFCFIFLVLSSFFVNAKIYQWTDENGKTHFSDIPPPAKLESKELKIAAELSHRSKSRQRVYEPSTPKHKDSAESKKLKFEVVKEQRKLCKESKEKYERYKREGIVGYNPFTGEKRMMTKEEEKYWLHSAKEDAEMFCEGVR